MVIQLMLTGLFLWSLAVLSIVTLWATWPTRRAGLGK